MGNVDPNGRSEMQEALMSYENDKYILYTYIYIYHLSEIHALYDKYSI